MKVDVKIVVFVNPTCKNFKKEEIIKAMKKHYFIIEDLDIEVFVPLYQDDFLIAADYLKKAYEVLHREGHNKIYLVTYEKDGVEYSWANYTPLVPVHHIMFKNMTSYVAISLKLD